MPEWNEIFMNRIKELLEKVKGKWEECGEWNSLQSIIDNFNNIMEIVKDVVVAVEITWSEFDEFPTEEKMNYAAKVLDDTFKFPGMLEWFDDKIFLLLIKMAVKAINDHLGHEWSAASWDRFDTHMGTYSVTA